MHNHPNCSDSTFFHYEFVNSNGAVKRYVATEIWVNIGAVTADQMLTYDQYSQVTFHHIIEQIHNRYFSH